MALSLKEIGNLMSILAVEQCASNSFENIAKTFQHYFTRQDGFKIGTALVLLLQNPDLLASRVQQLVDLFLLWEISKNDPVQSSPFVVVFYHALKSTDAKDTRHFKIPVLQFPERLFLYTLLSQYSANSPQRDLLKQTPQQVITTDLNSEALQKFRQQFSDLDLSFLDGPFLERSTELPRMACIGMPCTLSDPERKLNSKDLGSGAPSALNMDTQRAVLEGLLTGEAPTARACLRPEFLRLAPPLHASGTDDELVWMDPTEAEHPLLWDNSLGQSSSTAGEAKKLLAKAFKTSLPQSQVQVLTEALQKDPKILSGGLLSPSRLPDLVEQNPLVAIELLLALMRSGSPQVTDYFSILVNMEMSLHSMEVVNRLTTAVELPAEFIHLYISNCIAACEKKREDKYMQNRLVRLVCVFLQSLIRNRIIDFKDIFLEVQSFCIEFSRIREAAGLFRLLKSLESGNTIGSDSNSQTSTPTKNHD